MAGDRPEQPGSVRLARVHPLLAGIVDRIVDWDLPDGDAARRLGTRALPSTTPYLIAQYRVPMETDHQFRSSCYRLRYTHVATMVQTGVVTPRVSAPLGVLIVGLKPEAAGRLLGERLQGFADAKIYLDGLFRAADVSLLEEMLMEAPDSDARFARMQNFLLGHLHARRPDPAVCRAAQTLRRTPALRVRQLAAQLDISERQLCRVFRTVFGTSPKHFARVARIEKILSMRRGGSAWAEIAYACGFADQAHMINDFRAIVGEAPQQLLRATAGETGGADDAPIGRVAGTDFF